MVNSQGFSGVASKEFSKKFPNLPALFTNGSHVYEIHNIKDNGELEFRTVEGSTLTLDVNRDLNSIIEEGLANGIFAGESSVDSNPNGTVLRCEAIFELYRTLGRGVVVLGSYGEDDICGEETYYKSAVKWFLRESGPYGKGLYNFRDLEGALTWLELAYILYYCVRVPSKVGWTDLMLEDGLRISQINLGTKLDKRLASYKNTRWMKTYLNDIRVGKSYIPLPAFHAVRNIVADGLWPQSVAKIVDGELLLTKDEVDPDKSDWCLMEITRLDFDRVVKHFSGRM